MEPNLRPTKILDYHDPKLRSVATDLLEQNTPGRALIVAAHTFLMQAIRPVYTIDEWQPASVTFSKGRGSCSQRTACLEAVARAAGIPTRARALQISGRFWYPRFRFSRIFIPARILLVWPQFFVEQEWLDFDEIYSLVRMAREGDRPFTNDGESIFDAVAHTQVDFLGKTRREGCGPAVCDLSKFVVADDGFFDSRDDVFLRFGSFQYTWRGRAFELIFGGRKSF